MLSLHFIISESNRQKELLESANAIAKARDMQFQKLIASNSQSAEDNISSERVQQFLAGMRTLTPTERSIYNYYLENKSTKEIMALLNIKENTLKYHNKNIYSKLEVSSRKELMVIAKALPRQK